MSWNYWEDYHERNSEPEDHIINEYNISLFGEHYSTLNGAYRSINPDTKALKFMNSIDKIRAIKSVGGIVERREENKTKGTVSNWVIL